MHAFAQLSWFFFAISSHSIRSTLCSLPVVFSATKNDRFSAQKPAPAKRAKRSLFTFEKPANCQPKANIFDVFFYESKVSKAAFSELAFLSLNNLVIILK
jgi:hypothetical protein